MAAIELPGETSDNLYVRYVYPCGKEMLKGFGQELFPAVIEAIRVEPPEGLEALFTIRQTNAYDHCDTCAVGNINGTSEDTKVGQPLIIYQSDCGHCSQEVISRVAFVTLKRCGIIPEHCNIFSVEVDALYCSSCQNATFENLSSALSRAASTTGSPNLRSREELLKQIRLLYDAQLQGRLTRTMYDELLRIAARGYIHHVKAQQSLESWVKGERFNKYLIEELALRVHSESHGDLSDIEM